MGSVRGPMNKIAIVTVNYHGKQDTLEFLESLNKLDTKGLEIKTVVVDNGSADDSVEAIQKFNPDLTLLQTGENLGFSGGYNRGMRYALAWGADYLLVINNDTLISDRGLLKQLLKTAQADEKIGLVSPKIHFAPGFEFQENYSLEDKGKVIWYAGGHFDWNNIHSKHRGIDEVDKGQYDLVEKSDIASGACLLLKKEVLEQAGFFDEKLFAYYEDSDFYQRVKRAGFTIYYHGQTALYHKVSRTSGIGSPIHDYFHARNRLHFGFRYATTRTKFALLREAVKFLLLGRPMQRKGVWDFVTRQLSIPDKIKTKDPDKVTFPKLLSIVSSNYNTADLIKNLLESILKKPSGFDPRTMEVIILDDCSPTDPEPAIKGFLPNIQFYRNSINQGFTRSFNRLLHLSKGKYVLMLNSDIELLENCLTEFLKAEEKFQGQAVLGGRLYFPDMRTQDSVYHLPAIWGAIKEYFFNMQGSYFMYVPKPEVLTKVDGIVGACMFIPRMVMNKVGVLDERIISYFEDHEYSRRLGWYQVPIYFVPTAKLIHHHGASFKQLGSQTLEIHQKSAIQFHGRFYFALLYLTLWLCQKITRKKPPGSM